MWTGPFLQNAVPYKMALYETAPFFAVRNGLSLPPARRCRATSLSRGRRWARYKPKAPLSMAQATLSCRFAAIHLEGAAERMRGWGILFHQLRSALRRAVGSPPYRSVRFPLRL